MALSWPSLPQGSAQQDLRQSLYLLGRAVPAVANRNDGDALPHEQATLSVDVGAFDVALSPDEKQLAIGSVTGAASLWDVAAVLCRCACGVWPTAPRFRRWPALFCGRPT